MHNKHHRSATYLLFIVALCLNTLAAQTEFAGTVTDESGEPLAYATVYVKSSTCGTHTDGDGRFRFKCADDFAGTDSLLISFVGYQTAGVPLSAYLAGQNYALSPQSFSLGMVEVVANEQVGFEDYEFKYKIKKPYFYYQKDIQTNYELASRIENKDGVVGTLAKLEFTVGRVSRLETPIRLKFQAVDEDCNCPGQLLNTQDVVVKLKKGKNKVDLRDYQVPISDQGFYVVFEWLHQYSEDPNKLDFSIGMIPFRSEDQLLGKVGDGDWTLVKNAKNARVLTKVVVERVVE
ncbi:carboxypeptidase-like regulatory domain-containing protein [Lewinella sp. 4G2]|uniref:carboxypeptidase-like regulatory domain-containing protein n=1 Tax=Lewinella sp. 4G2 TaxID=1803372 RepID=UPI0007B46ABB|nr:carboxypeptidase-like regulatory domain-containing protein [Lewinella sp. 4G2]OAV42572.1 hypothetical protein A3850_015095 [Lewinella sp. 4G2]